MPPPDHSADQARAAIETALGQIGFCLPGSITIRRARCGKPRCACAADAPTLHGPYIQWTRTDKGKTVTRLLTAAQYQAYAPGSPAPAGSRTASRTGSAVPDGKGQGGRLGHDHPGPGPPAPSLPGSQTGPYHAKRRG